MATLAEWVQTKDAIQALRDDTECVWKTAIERAMGGHITAALRDVVADFDAALEQCEEIISDKRME